MIRIELTLPLSAQDQLALRALLAITVEEAPGSTPALPSPPTSLTTRELECVQAVVDGAGEKSLAIAQTLNMSEHTLHNHLGIIYSKLDVRGRTGLLAWAYRHGYTPAIGVC